MKKSNICLRSWFFFALLASYHHAVTGYTQIVQPQDSTVMRQAPDSARSVSAVPAGVLAIVQFLDFKNTEVKDIFRGLAIKYNLNIFVDDAVSARATLRLSNVTVHGVMEFLCREYGLDMKLENGIYRVRPVKASDLSPKILDVSYTRGLLSADLDNDPVSEAAHAIAQKTGKTILITRGVEGRVSGFIQNVPFEQGLTQLFQANGLAVRKHGEVYHVEKDRLEIAETSGKPGRVFRVDVQDSLISFDVADADLNRLIMECANQTGASLFMLTPPTGKVTARCGGLTFENMLNIVFKGTEFTYRKDGGIYYIGQSKDNAFLTTQIITLNHISAGSLMDSLGVEKPFAFKNAKEVRVVKEHNSIMITGTQDVIREAEAYIRMIDKPIPQILIEAVVVDFTSWDEFELGVNAWLQTGTDSSAVSKVADLLFPSVDITATGPNLNKSIQFYGPQLGIKSIGKLPANFMLNLRALESRGKANIRSVPQVATLNGHKASISIGTTQYYQLESYTPFAGGSNVFQQTAQRFEQIKAEIKLEIVPWVSASGEITAEIRPDFSTPRNFDSKTPPTIDYRKLESTVRLRNGETIALGGLIQNTESEGQDRFPLLGDIPVIGELFRNRNREKKKSHLMIYITPHLMYQDGFNGVIPGTLE
jgi:type IV pilus assembly protein PilQ